MVRVRPASNSCGNFLNAGLNREGTEMKTATTAVCVASICTAFVSTAIAHADSEYIGQTYAQAQQAIQQAGGTDTVASVVGDQLPTTQCRVTGSRTAGFLDSSGNAATGRILLDLNCNSSTGNSGASPQGQQSAQDQQAQQQAEAQQNEGDELLQSGNVPGVPGQIP